MQSLRSRIVLGLVRNRHLFRLKLKPEVIDDSFSVEEFRGRIDRVSRKMKLPKDVTARSVTAGGLNSEWIIPENAAPGKVLFYIHGGGFISGSCLTHRTHVAKFARGCRMKTLLFDYRLAPEHPFPAGLEDCVSAYEWLMNEGTAPEDIVVGGESAGGTLVLSLLLALKDRGIPLPAAAFSISPVTDLRCTADSFRRNARRDIAPTGSWTGWTDYYIAGHDPTDPLLSPQFGDFRGMPPLFFCIGTHEIHYDDCLAVAEKAAADGADVTLREWEAMVHAFPIMAPLFPEATAALGEICDFMRERAGGDAFGTPATPSGAA